MVNRLEQLFALIVTVGLVLGNFLLFTPWRQGQDLRSPASNPEQALP